MSVLPKSPRAILVTGPAWVGDMVMAQTLFIYLKQIYPDASIDVLAPGWTRPLLARMPQVRDAIELPFGHGDFKPMARYAVGKSLRAKKYDWAIVMPITWKSALVSLGARIPIRSGFLGEQRWGLINDRVTLEKQAHPLMIQRYLSLALQDREMPDPLPQPKLIVSERSQVDALNALGINKTDRPVMAFCPGAEYGPAKRWSPEYFSEIGKRLVKQGWDVWIFGSAKDAEYAQPIAAAVNSDRCLDLTGQTSMAQAIDLMVLTDAALANDSGLMHVAAALQKPIIALYGSSTPEYTPPLTDKASIVSLKLECSPCFKRECPLGHLNCLKQLTPDIVWREICAHIDGIDGKISG